MVNFTLNRKTTGLLIVDVQEKLFREVERSCEVMHMIQKVVKGFHILQLPIIVTEQYPEGLGSTVPTLKQVVGERAEVLSKTTFSCLGNDVMKQKLLAMNVTQWVVVGIEAHVCVLQTAKDLLKAGREVVVLNDAITSRSLYDFSTAIAELRDCGVRVSSTETVLFELLHDSKAPEFKQMSQLIKTG